MILNFKKFHSTIPVFHHSSIPPFQYSIPLFIHSLPVVVLRIDILLCAKTVTSDFVRFLYSREVGVGTLVVTHLGGLNS